MSFEDARKKLEDGTATEEEKAFLIAEVEKTQQLLKNQKETITTEGKSKHPQKIWILIGIIVGSLGLIAGIVCSIIFIPSTAAARKAQVIGRGDAVAIAREYVDEITGENATHYVVKDTDRLLHINGSLNDAVFVYRVKLRAMDGTEYIIRVDSSSCVPELSDIHHHRAY